MPKCRIAPSLGGGFAGTPNEVWGTDTYNPDTDTNEPCVFFGMYGLPDFYSLWRHKGKKWILWAGSDVTHFINGYWLEDGGGVKLNPEPLARWINNNCENWVENEVERLALAEFGILAQVCPSFLGNVNDYQEVFKPNDRPNVYLSANKGRELEYGWGIIEGIADKCNADFYLYGSDWETKHHNVFVRGRVPQEQMNKEIMGMQSGLRLNEGMDGFSEITAKSVLWGQYPLVWEHFKYPGLDNFKDKDSLIKAINMLKLKDKPNPARSFYVNKLNQYTWKK